ncbi:hypothetical protein ACFQ0O_00220 [Saccharopolyspora spinosporotrichia]
MMARMRREGNTLSATLRAAWEGGNLSTLGVTARIVRDAHVGILTHITPGEFHAKVSHSDMAGGTYNRFLPVFVAQTQFLPAGTGADPALIERLAVDLRARLDQGATLGQLGFSDEAAYLWRRLYVEFGGFSTEDGPIEQFLSRAAPNCLRVAASTPPSTAPPPSSPRTWSPRRRSSATPSTPPARCSAKPTRRWPSSPPTSARPGHRDAPAPRSPQASSRATPGRPASKRCWTSSSPTTPSPRPSAARRAGRRPRHRDLHCLRTPRTYEQCP